MYWEFLDTWDKPYLLVSDQHFILEISTDSSGYKWGATISGKDMKEGLISNYWDQNSLKLPIMLKEALALKNSLISIQHLIKCKRIIAHVDNQAVVYA